MGAVVKSAERALCRVLPTILGHRRTIIGKLVFIPWRARSERFDAGATKPNVAGLLVFRRARGGISSCALAERSLVWTRVRRLQIVGTTSTKGTLEAAGLPTIRGAAGASSALRNHCALSTCEGLPIEASVGSTCNSLFRAIVGNVTRTAVRGPTTAWGRRRTACQHTNGKYRKYDAKAPDSHEGGRTTVLTGRAI